MQTLQFTYSWAVYKLPTREPSTNYLLVSLLVYITLTWQSSTVRGVLAKSFIDKEEDFSEAQAHQHQK